MFGESGDGQSRADSNHPCRGPESDPGIPSLSTEGSPLPMIVNNQKGPDWLRNNKSPGKAKAMEAMRNLFLGASILAFGSGATDTQAAIWQIGTEESLMQHCCTNKMVKIAPPCRNSFDLTFTLCSIDQTCSADPQW